tara:strand:+ start:219 stop:590 length:372 start_codon:yes stop_codon:yes gene_type:complete
MKIQRLSHNAFEKIIDGDLTNEADCVIKFYSNSCHLCRGLKKPYEEIAEELSDEGLHFFAFNIDDYAHFERLGVNGVPSIAFVKVRSRNAEMTLLSDPDPTKADKESWYHRDDIVKFIQDNIQ